MQACLEGKHVPDRTCYGQPDTLASPGQHKVEKMASMLAGYKSEVQFLSGTG